MQPNPVTHIASASTSVLDHDFPNSRHPIGTCMGLDRLWSGVSRTAGTMGVNRRAGERMMACGIWGLTMMSAFSQTPPLMDYPARVESVANLKAHIAQREARFDLLKQDLLALDGRVEKQMDDIVKNLASLKDSNDSKTKVARIKGDVIEALVRTIWIYRQKRVDVFERMRKDSNVPQAELAKTLQTFDERINKRVEQVMELAKSFPGHQEVKKYESYGGSYYNGWYQENLRVSEEWKQNRRDNTAGRVTRREVLQELDKSLDKNQSRQRAVTDALANRKLSASERSLQQQELGRLDAAIDNLKTRRRELALPGGGATREIGAGEAHDAEQMLDDARGDLSRDFWEIMRKYSELDAERTRIFDLKSNLTAREEWLQKNPPPAQ